jgi:hypothetical protein
LTANHFTSGPGILASHLQAGYDRIRILVIERQKPNDILLICGRIAFEEQFLVTRRVDQGFPLELSLLPHINRQVERNVNKASNILGSLGVTTHPENRISNS